MFQRRFSLIKNPRLHSNLRHLRSITTANSFLKSKIFNSFPSDTIVKGRLQYSGATCFTFISAKSNVKSFRINSVISNVAKPPFTTKSGKPFGVMFIEDYTGSHELALFSDDYLKFKQYLTPEYYLFIRAKVQSRYNDPNNLEIKISSIKLLPDVGNEFAKSLTLSLSLDEINSETVNTLDILLKEYPGKLPVKFSVRDKENKVELASKKVRVNFSKKLFEELEYRQGIRFKINT